MGWEDDPGDERYPGAERRTTGMDIPTNCTITAE